MPIDEYYRNRWATRWLREHPDLPPRNGLNRFRFWRRLERTFGPLEPMIGMWEAMDPRIQAAMHLSGRPELGGEMTTYQLHKLVTDDEAITFGDAMIRDSDVG